jgi:hypothetical protein
MIANLIPADRGARWSLAREILGNWFAPCRVPHDLARMESELLEAESGLGFALPASLRELHLHFGHRCDVWNMQDRLLPPELLSVEDERLVIFRENQCVVEWAIEASHLDQADPPLPSLICRMPAFGT